MTDSRDALAADLILHGGQVATVNPAQPDLVVLSDDMLACPVERIKDATVIMTVLDGQVVHQR